MKKNYIILTIVVTLFVTGCSSNVPDNRTVEEIAQEELDNKIGYYSSVGKILYGNHEFKLIDGKDDTDQVQVVTKSNVSSEYVYESSEDITYVPTVEAQEEKKYIEYSSMYVSFIWKMNTGEYIKSELDKDKIQVRIIDGLSEPYIKFCWEKGRTTDINQIMKSYVVYVVICCNESDYKYFKF